MRVTWDEGKRPDGFREPDELDAFHLELLRKEHEAASNGIHAARAVVFCYESRIMPPQWLSDWVGEGFTTWIDGKGRKTLDKILDLAPAGPGRRHPLELFDRENERGNDAFVMCILTSVFKFSVDKAAEMLQRRSEAQNRETPDASWLAESYRKRWRREFADAKWASVIELYQKEETRQKFLASFPPL